MRQVAFTDDLHPHQNGRVPVAEQSGQGTETGFLDLLIAEGRCLKRIEDDKPWTLRRAGRHTVDPVAQTQTEITEVLTRRVMVEQVHVRAFGGTGELTARVVVLRCRQGHVPALVHCIGDHELHRLRRPGTG